MPTSRAKIQPSHRVVTVAFDGLPTFEFGIAVELFALPRPEFPWWYQFKVCSIEKGDVRATGGITLSGCGGISLLAQADTIVVPGWRGVGNPVPEKLLTALRRAHARGARLISFCSGAFVLAAAGLLDGKRAATHWKYAESLAANYPQIVVDRDVLYVDEGAILTSAGSAAAIDLCLHVIRKDHGAETANAVARRLVVSPHREGGQSQFIKTTVSPEFERNPITDLMAWLRQHLSDDFSIAQLAKRAKMSERSFARQFKDSTGTTPHRWLLRERVMAAQSELEKSRRSIEEIACACGFGCATTFRHHFQRLVGISPRQYRSTFTHRAS